jgi:hypothetical protein
VVAAMVTTVAVTMEVVVMEATVAVTMVVAATVAMVKMLITDIIKMNFLNYCIKISVYKDKMLCLLRKI